MSLVIMLPNELEAKIQEAAARQGLGTEEYVIMAVKQALTKRALDEDFAPARTPELELDEILDELAAGTEHLPPLPPNFSRADIYFDHD